MTEVKKKIQRQSANPVDNFKADLPGYDEQPTLGYKKTKK